MDALKPPFHADPHFFCPISGLRFREIDRNALLLRFFENKPLAAVGAALGIPEDAARKRVHRALERLHADLVRHGVDAPAAILPGLLGTYAAPGSQAPLVHSTLAQALSASGTPSLKPGPSLLIAAIGRRLLWDGLRPWIAGAALLVSATGSWISLRPAAPAPTAAIPPGSDDYTAAWFPDAGGVVRLVAALQQRVAGDRRADLADLARYPLRGSVDGVRTCPADPLREARLRDRSCGFVPNYYTSDGQPQNFGGPTGDPIFGFDPDRNVDSLLRPSETFLLFETSNSGVIPGPRAVFDDHTHPDTWLFGCGHVTADIDPYRHGRGANYLFGDWHVATIPGDKLRARIEAGDNFAVIPR